MELHRSLVDYVPLGKDGLQLREAGDALDGKCLFPSR